MASQRAQVERTEIKSHEKLSLYVFFVSGEFIFKVYVKGEKKKKEEKIWLQNFSLTDSCTILTNVWCLQASTFFSCISALLQS